MWRLTQPQLTPIIDALLAYGARPILVGGAVRDHLLGLPFHEADIEVFGLNDVAELAQILLAFGTLDERGRDFGVLGIKGRHAQFGLPRQEHKTGEGYRGFEVIINGKLNYKTAAKRRDFTLNSMGLDLATDELLDPYGGQVDLAAKTLRHISPAFTEDPLRVLRAVQLAARFDLTLAPETLTCCQAMAPHLQELNPAHMRAEILKAKGAPFPDRGRAVMVQTGIAAAYPELLALL